MLQTPSYGWVPIISLRSKYQNEKEEKNLFSKIKRNGGNRWVTH